jgi:hypothetical protein
MDFLKYIYISWPQVALNLKHLPFIFHFLHFRLLVFIFFFSSVCAISSHIFAMLPLFEAPHCYSKLPLLLQEEKNLHAWHVAAMWHCIEGDPREEGNHIATTWHCGGRRPLHIVIALKEIRLRAL